jgi:hypothetical protein
LSKAQETKLVKPVVVLWSYPGAGKSYFARWLVERKSFEHIDTDQLGNRQRTSLEEAWWRAINGNVPIRTFIAAAKVYGRPIVAEYGVWGTGETVARLGELQRQGAVVWWFDADRSAAFAEWKAENKRLSRQFPDELWSNVVRSIDQHWSSLAEIFGSHVLRTLDPGPVRREPEEIYASMFSSGTATSPRSGGL